MLPKKIAPNKYINPTAPMTKNNNVIVTRITVCKKMFFVATPYPQNSLQNAVSGAFHEKYTKFPENIGDFYIYLPKKFFLGELRKKSNYHFNVEFGELSISEVFRAIPALCREIGANIICFCEWIFLRNLQNMISGLAHDPDQ